MNFVVWVVFSIEEQEHQKIMEGNNGEVNPRQANNSLGFSLKGDAMELERRLIYGDYEIYSFRNGLKRLVRIERRD